MAARRRHQNSSNDAPLCTVIDRCGARETRAEIRAAAGALNHLAYDNAINQAASFGRCSRHRGSGVRRTRTAARGRQAGVERLPLAEYARDCDNYELQRRLDR